MNPQTDALPNTTPVLLAECKGCNWPLGHKAPYLFCNAPVELGKSPRWCDAHSKIGLVPVRITLRGKGRRK